MRSRRILFIGAHPDDETVFAGGTLAKYASEGARVSVICATRGQRGSTASLCSIEALPAVREAELRDACAILGVQDVHVLDYDDAKLTHTPPARVEHDIEKIIRARKPQVVITFAEDGATGHADHRAIHRFATTAVTRCEFVERLLYTTEVRVWQLADTEDLERKAGIDFIINTGAQARAKQKALGAHRTQYSGLRNVFPPHRPELVSVEAFRLASGTRPRDIPACDLFGL